METQMENDELLMNKNALNIESIREENNENKMNPLCDPGRNENSCSEYENFTKAIFEVQNLKDEMNSFFDEMEQLKVKIEERNTIFDLLLETINSKPQELHDIVSEIHDKLSEDDINVKKLSLKDIIRDITDNDLFKK